MRRLLPLLLPSLLLACSGEGDGTLADGGADASVDGGLTDGGPVADSGTSSDGGAIDGGAAEDAASPADSGPADARVARWEDLPPVSGGPLQETAVVAFQDEVWVIGGFGADLAFGRRVEIYDPLANRWRSGPELPVPMHHAQAAVAGGTVWILGFLGDRFRHDGRIYALDLAMNRWEARGTMPAGRERGSGATAVWDDRIYLVGGLRNTLPVADFDQFDPATGAWSPLPPLPRVMDHGVAAAADGRVFVAGGRTGSIDAHSAALDVFDLTAARWTAGPPMPTSRGGTAGALLGRRFYVFGGEGNRGAPPHFLFAEVEAYDLDANAWSSLPEMVPPRHGTGAAAIGGAIYVPGGANVQAFGAVDLMQVFHP